MIIKNTTIIKDFDNVIFNKSIVIKDDMIDFVGDFDDIKNIDDEIIIDGTDKRFMPGLIDCHMHTGQQLLKGKVLDAKPIIRKRIMLPFESTITEDDMEFMAELAAIEMIKSGTVGFIEAGSYHMKKAAEVYQKSGMIGAITHSTMDNPELPSSIRETTSECIEKLDELYDEFNGDKIKVYYSLRALNDCSVDLIKEVFSHAKKRDTYVIAHMNEYQKEVDGIIERYGKHPYEFLHDLGVFPSKFMGAHSLILSNIEKEIIKDNHISLCHCPFSNSGKGVPDTPKLLDMGINIGLGTDGAAHGGLSLWNEMKIFRSIMNLFHGVPHNIANVMPAKEILKMATENGYNILEEKAGKIEKGYKADIISIRSDKISLIPTHNIINTLLEEVNANDVCDSIIRGELVMKDRKVQTLNEEEILKKAKEYNNALNNIN